MTDAQLLLTEIYLSGDLKVLKGKLSANNADDIIQEVFCDLYSIPGDRIIDLHSRGKLKYYIATCIYNRQKQFAKKDNKLRTVELTNQDTTDEQIEHVDYDVNKLDEYRRTVIQVYANTGSVHHVSKALRISVGSTHSALKEARWLLKKQIQ